MRSCLGSRVLPACSAGDRANAPRRSALPRVSKSRGQSHAGVQRHHPRVEGTRRNILRCLESAPVSLIIPLASVFSVVFANAGDRFPPATQQDVMAAVERMRQGIWGWQPEVGSGDQGRPGDSTDVCHSAREVHRRTANIRVAGNRQCSLAVPDLVAEVIRAAIWEAEGRDHWKGFAPIDPTS